MPRVPPVTTATRAIYSSPLCCCHSLKTFMPSTRPGMMQVGRSIAMVCALPLRASLLDACSLPLHAHGDAHAAADAERGEALLGVALLHLEQKRGEHARAGCADRMPERNGAAVDVDLGGIPAEVLVDRAGLGGEGLIGL